MARQTLDENESGAFTGDGGASNNSKANDNFEDLDAEVLVVDVVANDTNKAKVAKLDARTVAGIALKRHTAIASALGDVVVHVLDGDGNTLMSTATIDAEALTASFVAQTLTATTANLALAAGEPVEVKVVSDNADATGGPVIAKLTYAAA